MSGVRVTPCGSVANMVDCDIIWSKFEHQSYYFINFRTHSDGKDMIPTMG